MTKYHPKREVILLTPEGYADLQTELVYRKDTLRPQLASELQEALDLGDTPENHPYDVAKDKHNFNEARIAELANVLRHAKIARPATDTGIVIGNTITLKKEDGSIRIVQIVNTFEANSLAGKVSAASPLGEALLHCQVGQTICLSNPQGQIGYTIIDIKR